MELTHLQKREIYENGYVHLPGVVPRVMVDAALRAINHSVGEGMNADEMVVAGADLLPGPQPPHSHRRPVQRDPCAFAHRVGDRRGDDPADPQRPDRASLPDDAGPAAGRPPAPGRDVFPNERRPGGDDREASRPCIRHPAQRPALAPCRQLHRLARHAPSPHIPGAHTAVAPERDACHGAAGAGPDHGASRGYRLLPLPDRPRRHPERLAARPLRHLLPADPRGPTRARNGRA